MLRLLTATVMSNFGTKQVHVAVWAPAGTPGAAKAYQLSAEGAKKLSDRMVGVAVTYAHSGIHEALDIVETVGAPLTKPNLVRAMEQSSVLRPRQRPLGLVTDAWIAANGDAMCTFYTQSAAANALITGGNLGSVSLTHVAETMNPLELSICNAPARPGSKVVLANASGEEAARYKARSLKPANRPKTKDCAMPKSSTDETVVVAAATPKPVASAPAAEKAPPSVSDALAQLPEAAQAVLAKRMKELTDQYTRKNSELVEASSKLSEVEKRLKLTDAFMQTESDILKDQLEMLLNACPDSVRQMYSATIPKLVDGFSSGDPRATMDAAVRTVMCASRALQLRSSAEVDEVQPPAKRLRQTAGSDVMDAAADAPETVEEADAPPALEKVSEPVAPPIVAAAAAPAVAAAAAAAAPTNAEPPSNLDVLNSALSMAFD